MGETFKDSLIRGLRGDAPTYGGFNIPTNLWEQTEKLRKDIIDSAIQVELDRNPPGFGVRRSEICRKIAHLLGVTRPVRHGSDLLEAAGELDSLSGDLTVEALGRYLRWVDEIYRLNQADRSLVRPSSLEVEGDVLAILKHARTATANTDIAAVPSDSFEASIRIPSLKRLDQLHPKQLQHLRDIGWGWRDAWSTFQESPTTTTRHAAEKTLEEYASQIRKQMPGAAQSAVNIKAVAAAVGVQGMAVAADILTQSLESLMSVPASAVVASVSSGVLIFKYLQSKRGTQYTVRLPRVNNFILPSE
ncbi:hypothetical protein [Streptomyces lydicus]|uniref:hypothetical protein n=1 Tax=Streptomyces lydicus TaxID=47763 RepID=UPI0036EF4AE4